MSERELDQLLDAALPGYLAEPPAGLPERVLARARRSRVWPWVAGLAAAAAFAVVALVPKPPVIEVPPLVAVHASHAPAVRLTPVARRVPRALRPVPMTAAERALMRFAESNPALIEQVLVEAPKQMALDLSIEPITIEPLSTGGE